MAIVSLSVCTPPHVPQLEPVAPVTCPLNPQPGDPTPEAPVAPRLRLTLWTMQRTPGGKWGRVRPHLLDANVTWVLPVNPRGDARPELAVMTTAHELLLFPARDP